MMVRTPAPSHTGATGSNAATLNGVYKQQQPDLYRKVDGVDGDGKEGVWLYFATDRRWHVSSRTANMAARKPCEHSYGHTITPVADTAGKPAPPRQPHEVKGGWLVDLGGDDVGESVKESTVAVAAIAADEAARLAAASTAAWDTAVGAAAGGETLVVAGTTGPRQKYIDGRYRRVDGRAPGQAPVYELVLPDDQKGEKGVHLGVGCDGCGACPIRGLRNKCTTPGCDYDLCATCCGSAEKKAAHAGGKHAFAAYETKRWLYLSHVAKWFVSGVRADMEKRLNRGFAFSAAAVPDGTLPTAVAGWDVGGEVQTCVVVTAEAAVEG